MKPLILILFLGLVGCNQRTNMGPLDGLVCSQSQIKLAEAQFNVCNKSSYISSYCLENAFKGHCDYKVK